MLRPLRQTKPADQDIEHIWDYTARRYNAEQADAYTDLIGQALRDIEQDPERPSSRKHPDLGEEIRSYRVDLSKRRSGTGIKSPRHVIFYTLAYDDEILVLRILHETMEPYRHSLED